MIYYRTEANSRGGTRTSVPKDADHEEHVKKKVKSVGSAVAAMFFHKNQWTWRHFALRPFRFNLCAFNPD